ncbi:MAG: type VI secretion protein ImpB [Pseudomonadota bacterium]
MRKPAAVECLYLDFDGFFASVEQQARPGLRGRPVGVVPFAGTNRTCVIAASKEAKARGVTNVMNVADALRICPDIALIPQSPDLYRRAHNTLLAEIATVVPIDAIKSIDELACRVDAAQATRPRAVAHAVKSRIVRNVGSSITCSIGFAANRHLAKIACKMDKPDGVTIWSPDVLPGPLLALKLEDIPGIGRRMEGRLAAAGIKTTRQLYEAQPKRLRKIWNNVIGERMWYALHGYALAAEPTERGMFGHGRVLSPEERTLPKARDMARLLLVKAARRLRREGYLASRLLVFLELRGGEWTQRRSLPAVRDDQAVLSAFEVIWAETRRLPRNSLVFRVGVQLYDISPSDERQTDMLLDDDAERQRWEAITAATDALNSKYGGTFVHIGDWSPPEGGNAGGKISYTRIPSAEDFW